MSSVIGEGLESCNKNSGCTDINVKICNDHGWNLIQALTNNVKKEVGQTEEVYVHPLFKLSASTLSSKSLEMCTESLGSETGSDISSDDFITPLSLDNEKAQLPNDEFSLLTSETKHTNCGAYIKKMITCQKFPPPLTSISGLDGGVQVRPHREGGRLIIKATEVPCRHSNFQADRRDGRLRLSVVKESSNAEMNKEKDAVEHENENEGEECWYEEIVGVGELPRPSRCKEGGRGKYINWGSCHFLKVI